MLNDPVPLPITFVTRSIKIYLTSETDTFGRLLTRGLPLPEPAYLSCHHTD